MIDLECITEQEVASEPIVYREATDPLFLFGEFALVGENSILGELITGQRSYITVNNKQLPIPDPSKLNKKIISIEGVEVEAVLLRPPFTYLDRLLKYKQANLQHQLDIEWDEFKLYMQGTKEFPGAYGKLLEDCTSFRVPAIWGYNMCHPGVPKGECWVSFGTPSQESHYIRFPVASDSALRECKCKRIKGFNLPLIFTNPKEFKDDHGGDSDGDQTFLIDKDPDEKIPCEITELPDLVYRLEVNTYDIDLKQKDTRTVARGYLAKRVVGIITWLAWGICAAYMKMHNGSRPAYRKSWRFFGNLLELAFDGRKEGQEFNMDIIDGLQGKTYLNKELCKSLGCEDIPETVFMAQTMPKTIGFQMWLRRFKGIPLPTEKKTVITALLDIWKGNYSNGEYDRYEA